MVDFKEYQARTAETAIYPNAKSVREKLHIAGFTPFQIDTIMRDTYANVIGLNYVGHGLGEAGEVQGKIKKMLRDDNGVVTYERRTAIAKELGDMLWYVSQTATELNLDLEDIAAANLEKLAARKDRGVLQGDGDDR